MTTTPNLREAAQAALEVLSYRGDYRNPKRHDKRRKAIEDLRAALAEPGPVATQMQMLDHLKSIKTDPATLAQLRAAAGY